MARALKITYGTLVVGLTPSNAAFELTDKFEFAEERTKFRCAFTVVIISATAGGSISSVSISSHPL